ncbi:dihydrofolate reductase family protein [uncultured Allobaculum sp.]|uniref:dihydrofolate reductase family protein n=1 Tax=uncultured Allobaculum sp. TaxID=1187017 RepID=UPI00210852FF|nr:dihydrofolate reductase family protein [Allobaculum fili]
MPRVCEILKDEFHVGRMVVVGGGTINGAFLDAGLLDEVSILLGPAIDGHNGMRAVFDGLPMDRKPFKLHLDHVQSYPDGAIWLRYTFR